jgi:CheY-like chemotaxis protein
VKPRVLIVDDERSMCELLETDLRLRDLFPCCFTSAQQAFEAFLREDFAVVLTDLKTPGMDGIQFCSRLVASPAACRKRAPWRFATPWRFGTRPAQTDCGLFA